MFLRRRWGYCSESVRVLFHLHLFGINNNIQWWPAYLLPYITRTGQHFLWSFKCLCHPPIPLCWFFNTLFVINNPLPFYFNGLSWIICKPSTVIVSAISVSNITKLYIKVLWVWIPISSDAISVIVMKLNDRFYS